MDFGAPDDVLEYPRSVLELRLPAGNAELARIVGPLIAAVMRPGGIVVANHELAVSGWSLLPEPPGVKPGRYFLYHSDTMPD